jgi:hypothetical protein
MMDCSKEKAGKRGGTQLLRGFHCHSTFWCVLVAVAY